MQKGLQDRRLKEGKKVITGVRQELSPLPNFKKNSPEHHITQCSDHRNGVIPKYKRRLTKKEPSFDFADLHPKHHCTRRRSLQRCFEKLTWEFPLNVACRCLPGSNTHSVELGYAVGRGVESQDHVFALPNDRAL
jgi:hypothetical protein